MKKLSEIKKIQVIAVFLAVFQIVTPTMAADIQMMNNQPVAVLSAGATEKNPIQETSQIPANQNSFDSGPLSAAAPASNWATYSSAYGNAVATDWGYSAYSISANGFMVSNYNETDKVIVTVNGSYQPQKVTDEINVGPQHWVYYPQYVSTPVTLTSNSKVTLSDALNSRAGGNAEPMSTLPQFVMINGAFVQLEVKAAGSSPLGVPQYDVSFTVPQLKGDGTDQIKFLSVYDSKTILAKSYLIDSFGAMQPKPKDLPLGWGITSNTNFAYRTTFTNSSNPMAGNEVLSVMNLKTGEIYNVYDKSAGLEDIWDKPNVSSDGKYVVVETRTSQGTVNVYVQELKTNISARVVSLGGATPKAPNAITFSGTDAIIQVEKPAGSFRVNMVTGKLTYIPLTTIKWTVAKSNARYKIALVKHPNSPQSLYVWNLDTNTVTIIGDWDLGSVVDFYDVSPSGDTVIYGEKANVAQKKWGSTRLYSLTVPGKKASHAGPVNYSFTDYNEVAIQTLDSNPIAVYNLETLKREALPPSGQQTITSPNGVYLVKDEMGTGRVLIQKKGAPYQVEVLFDISEAPITSVMVTNSRLYYVAGHDNPASIKFIDLDAINFNNSKLSILPASVKKTWNVTSVSIADRNSVQFSQEEGTVSFQDKTGKTQTFLLGSPSNWAIVASNKNFAYRLATDEFEQSATLKILNLKTGQIHSVATLDNGGMNGEVFDVSKLAVSPDGKTVVYEKGNRAGNFTVVSSIEAFEEGSRELVGSLTKAPVFSGAQVTLSLLPSGESKSVLVSLNTKTLMTAREQTIAGYFQTLLSRAPTWDELSGYGDPSLSYAVIRVEILLGAERLDRIHEIVSREFGFEVKPETVLYFAKQGRTYAQIKVDAAALFKLTPKQFLSNW